MVVKASVYELPFIYGTFDRVYSIGVLQHTPDHKKYIKCLSENVKNNGGEICIWCYEKTFKAYLRYKYLMRYFIKHTNFKFKLALSKALVEIFLPIFYPFSDLIHRNFHERGVLFDRFAPFALRYDKDIAYCKELSILDTLDNLSPEYDTPVTEQRLMHYLLAAGAKSVKRNISGGLAMVARF